MNTDEGRAKFENWYTNLHGSWEEDLQVDDEEWAYLDTSVQLAFQAYQQATKDNAEEIEQLRESLIWFLYASPFQLREAQAIMDLEAVINPNCPYRKAKVALKEANHGN